MFAPKQAMFRTQPIDLTAPRNTGALSSLTTLSGLGRGPGLEDALGGGLLRPVRSGADGCAGGARNRSDIRTHEHIGDPGLGAYLVRTRGSECPLGG